MPPTSFQYDEIIAAHERIKPFIHRTPVLTSVTADSLANTQLFFKCENFQRTGAFKFRGACNALSSLSDEQRKAGVIAYSSGNHAQSVALSGRIMDIPVTILIPEDAPRVKIEATRDYGANILFYDRYTQDREKLGETLAHDRNLTLIPPYNHLHIMQGQGTTAKELLEETGPLDVLLVPLGGGGLLSGCATAARQLAPSCHIYGIEPEAGDDGLQSFRAGRIISIPTPHTIADGAQTQHLGNLTFPIIRENVTDIVTVSDDELIEAMIFFASRMKIIVEPTGCLAAAAAFSGRLDLHNKRVGIIISGGNINLQNFANVIQTKK